MSNVTELSRSDNYVERLKKLIPSEVSAGFLAINALVPVDSRYLIYVLGFFAALVVLCIFYMYLIEEIRNIYQIIFVSLVAFPIWSINISMFRIDWMTGKEFLAGCLLIIVTLIVPLIVRPTKPEA